MLGGSQDGSYVSSQKSASIISVSSSIKPSAKKLIVPGETTVEVGDEIIATHFLGIESMEIFTTVGGVSSLIGRLQEEDEKKYFIKRLPQEREAPSRIVKLRDGKRVKRVDYS